MKPIIRFTSLIPAVAVAFLACAAWALDLQSAREQGLVGEKSNGYIAAIEETPGVKQLVAEVNARRREEYQKISKGNGQPVDVVARLAAAQIAQKLTPGSFYEGKGGAWVKR